MPLLQLTLLRHGVYRQIGMNTSSAEDRQSRQDKVSTLPAGERKEVDFECSFNSAPATLAKDSANYQLNHHYLRFVAIITLMYRELFVRLKEELGIEKERYYRDSKECFTQGGGRLSLQ